MTGPAQPLDATSANEASRVAWEANAAYWDERMGEGNDFVEKLSWPALSGLLDVQRGQRILDVACGNGLMARRLAALGAEVVAFDFSEALLERARARTAYGAHITYVLLDATDEAGLVALGTQSFDGALSNMALMDMPLVAPLYGALASVLRPGAPFVFSVTHPAFNGSAFSLFAERTDSAGELRTEYGVRVTGYLDVTSTIGVAIAGQPAPQPYFHRPLAELLRPAFEAGFVLDGLEERAFTIEDRDEGRGPTWNNLAGIPPVLVARLRVASTPGPEPHLESP